MTPRVRVMLAVAATMVLAAVAGTYTVRVAARSAALAPRPTGDPGLVLDVPGTLLYRTAAGTVAGRPLADPTAPPVESALRCARFSAAHGTGVCLTSPTGPLGRGDAVILDAALHEKQRIPLAGLPSRARVSASGRMVSWTVFVTGDSYLSTGFAAWTSILDTRTGELIGNIETLTLTLDGRPYHSPDVNFWGITFAGGDNTFYATVGTKGRTYLVRGNLADWTAETLRENAECPSLSPDGTRIAYKKRVGGDLRQPWRLHVLDLRTGADTPLAEPASVDDQALWLNDSDIAYARPANGRGRDDPADLAGASTAMPVGARTDVWAVPADGTGRPELLVPGGSSPAVLR